MRDIELFLLDVERLKIDNAKNGIEEGASGLLPDIFVLKR